MEERSLKITGADKTFFNRLSTTLTKILIPTQIGINGMLITVKRNALIKAFENYNNPEIEKDKKETLEEKYEQTYTAYLEALDKYVLDSIYKKVKNNSATEYEKNALSQYYEITRLKEPEYVEYKYRKQKYLIELDYEGLKASNKEKVLERYYGFYINKMDMLYKGILKNYSIKLADTTNLYDATKDWVYTKIFYTLEEYIKNILALKIKENKEDIMQDVLNEYEKYENFEVGKLDTKDTIEKNTILLALSRKLFTHSLPLVVTEQCYKKLLRDARNLVQDTKIAVKREKAYSMLIKIIEEYNTKLLATKVYWENEEEKNTFKKFWDKYKENEKIKETDFIEYVKQKEILFMKDDMKKLHDEKTDYTRLIKYYKRKLLDYNAIRELKGVKSEGKYIKNKIKV